VPWSIAIEPNTECVVEHLRGVSFAVETHLTTYFQIQLSYLDEDPRRIPSGSEGARAPTVLPAQVELYLVCIGGRVLGEWSHIAHAGIVGLEHTTGAQGSAQEEKWSNVHGCVGQRSGSDVVLGSVIMICPDPTLVCSPVTIVCQPDTLVCSRVTMVCRRDTRV
jgi:hypothetical protein